MKYLLATIALIVLRIYHPWFDFTKTLSSGDWPNLYRENIQGFSLFPQAPFLWLEPYYNLTAKFGTLLFSWEITEKLFWFIPFIIISIIGSWLFAYSLLTYVRESSYRKVFAGLGSLIYVSNTYILMIVGGGQMGVGIAYSLVPLILYLFINFLNTKNRLNTINVLIIGFVSGIQLMFDPRIFLLSIFIVFLYILFTFKDLSRKIIKKIILALTMAVVINLFWILPNLGYFNTEYRSAVDAVNADFLSFATFSNSISLLHPNWPENIFGKIGFMRSEFLILPILAFLSLFFAKKNKQILFFIFLGIFGAFFAKGTNPPFGELYRWISNFPGFSIFRDPTKFYVLVAVSYMVLIPYSLVKLTEKALIVKYNYVIGIGFLVFWSMLIKPALLGNLTGTFKPHVVPQEYVQLKDFLNSKSEFTKTLWIPSVERFGYNSRIKPAISSMELFGVGSVLGVLEKFDGPGIKKQLMEEDIAYVIVPYDYLREIFLTERQYDNSLYIKSIDRLRRFSWLTEVKNNNFGRIKVFEAKY